MQFNEPTSGISRLDSTFLPNATGVMSPEPKIDRTGSIINKKGTGPSSSAGDKKEDGSEKIYHQLKPKHQRIK